MRFFTLILSYLLLSSTIIKGQDTIWHNDYNTDPIDTSYIVDNNGGTTTYSLTQADGQLKIDYNRTASSNTWTQFNLALSGVSLLSESKIFIDIKSTVAFQIAVKPVSGSASDWLTKDIPGNSNLTTYTFNLSGVNYMDLEHIYFYFDGGSSSPKSGTVYFDNLRVITTPVVLTIPKNLIDKAELFVSSIVEGSNEGEYEVGTKDLVNLAIDNVKAHNIAGISDIKTMNQYIDNLNDTLMLADSKVNLFSHPLIDQKATKQAVRLYSNLKKIMGQRFLFGMHDATSYGINENKTGWTDNGTGERSDVKTVCGSHPALFSVDFNDAIEKNQADKIRKLMLKADSLGGIITMVWHQDNLKGGDAWTITNVVSTMLTGGTNHTLYLDKLKKLAAFAKSMRNDKGQSIPILFRPYHEQSGSWFWWGKGNCTPQEYVDLWQQTANYLKDTLGVHNFIYVISPDAQQYSTKAQYMNIYPGDSYIDVFGLDFYFGSGEQSEINRFSERVSWISEFAVEKNKVAAVAEVGDRYLWEANGAPDALVINNWYTRCFLGGIKNATTNKIAYGATWRNGSITHHFAPYPGHKSVPDFLNFFDDTTTLFLNDINDFYNDKDTASLEKPMSGCRITDYKINKTNAMVDLWKPSIGNLSIKISLVDTLDLSALIPVFKSSAGSIIKVNNEIQQSGVTSINLNNSINYTVVAQNQKDSSEYHIVVELIKPDTLTSISSVDSKNVMKVFPNPVSEYLNISCTEEISIIQLFNINGQLLYSSKIKSSNAMVNIQHLKNESYLLKVISNNGNVFKQLILKE